jgi:predicted hotdog family 3-hydroxylacyl-ACP dehydratase
MLIPKSQILDYIPQKPPFVMIDELVEASEKGFTTTFTIAEDNVLLENNRFKEVGLIENIAQTAAAGFTYLDKQNSASEEPKIGFIGSVNRLICHKTPNLHDKIETTVTPEMTFENITLVKGEVKLNGETIITCELKIAIISDTNIFE